MPAIFFSDVINFTETTDKLESEDLTNVLNRYLTEMSNIALENRATIDFKVLLDLQKHDRAEAVAALEAIVARLKK